MKRLAVIFIFIFLFSFGVKAEESTTYEEQYKSSGIEEIKQSIDKDTLNYLEQYGINPSDRNIADKLSTENVFGHIWNFFKSGLARPLKCLASILCIVLITCLITAFSKTSYSFAPATFAGTLAASIIMAKDLWSAVNAAVSALKACSAFMLSFVPAFAGIVTLSGKAVTGAAAGAALLIAAQAVSNISSFFILPLMGGYLAISICSGISPFLSGTKTAETVKKIAVFVLSLVTTVFIGVISIQTAVNSNADTLSLKTAKFLLGSGVPIAGAALSEAAGTVYASMSLLKSTVGIYGVAVVAAIMLPILCELIIWRGVMLLSSALSDMFGNEKMSSLLRAVDMMLAVLAGVLLTVVFTFIISLSTVVKAGGG